MNSLKKTASSLQLTKGYVSYCIPFFEAEEGGFEADELSKEGNPTQV